MFTDSDVMTAHLTDVGAFGAGLAWPNDTLTAANERTDTNINFFIDFPSDRPNRVKNGSATLNSTRFCH